EATASWLMWWTVIGTPAAVTSTPSAKAAAMAVKYFIHSSSDCECLSAIESAAARIVCRRLAGRLHAERQTDACSYRPRRFRHSVGVVRLRSIVHGEQPACLEVDLSHFSP